MKLLSTSAMIAVLALGPIAANAGNLEAVAPEAPILAPVTDTGVLSGGLGTAGAVAVGALGLLALAAVLDDDDDSSSATTTTPSNGGEED